MKDTTNELRNRPTEMADTDEDVGTETPEEDDQRRGGADGKSKALGTPGLGGHGRPNKRESADE